MISLRSPQPPLAPTQRPSGPRARRSPLWSTFTRWSVQTFALALATAPLEAARAQGSWSSVLSLAKTRADSLEINAMMASGSAAFLPLLVGADATRLYVSLSGVVEEGPGVLRAWLLSVAPGGVVDAARTRLDCEAGTITTSPVSVRGLAVPALTAPSSFGRAVCLLVDALATTRSLDAGGMALREERRADSIAFFGRRWRAVRGLPTLEVAPESRKTTTEGREAWLRFPNRAGGTTVGFYIAHCAENRLRLAEGKWTDSLGVEGRLAGELNAARVSPESEEEARLRAVCSTGDLAEWQPQRGELPPEGLLGAAPRTAPTATVQTATNAGPRPWLAELQRRGRAP